jgi:hypothetical protein
MIEIFYIFSLVLVFTKSLETDLPKRSKTLRWKPLTFGDINLINVCRYSCLGIVNIDPKLMFKRF